MKWHDDLFFGLGVTPLLMAPLACGKGKTIMPEYSDNFIRLKAGIFGTKVKGLVL